VWSDEDRQLRRGVAWFTLHAPCYTGIMSGKTRFWSFLIVGTFLGAALFFCWPDLAPTDRLWFTLRGAGMGLLGSWGAYSARGAGC
jgi:hypothetical protein